MPRNVSRPNTSFDVVAYASRKISAAIQQTSAPQFIALEGSRFGTCNGDMAGFAAALAYSIAMETGGSREWFLGSRKSLAHSQPPPAAKLVI
jgi:hypothetical protein